VVVGGLAGAVGALGLLALFRTMELGTMGTASPIATLSPVTTVALAWAIAREPFTHYEGLGIGVAPTGALFLSGAA
jgi:uncharacterized membrane protein